jgi:hypothetical protein
MAGNASDLCECAPTLHWQEDVGGERGSRRGCDVADAIDEAESEGEEVKVPAAQNRQLQYEVVNASHGCSNCFWIANVTARALALAVRRCAAHATEPFFSSKNF